MNSIGKRLNNLQAKGIGLRRQNSYAIGARGFKNLQATVNPGSANRLIQQDRNTNVPNSYNSNTVHMPIGMNVKPIVDNSQYKSLERGQDQRHRLKLPDKFM